MKRPIALACILTAALFAQAQNPKWFKKARKAQISIITFDENGQHLKSGNGFFISEDGTALANYQLFEDAASAKAVDNDGKEYQVNSIMGANSLYDVVKFKVVTEKKTNALSVSERAGAESEHVYIMPYPTSEKAICLNDTLKKIQKFNKQYHYYSLGREINEHYTNCPVMSDEGELLGMIQQPANSQSKTKAYAISANYGQSLSVNSLSATNSDLNAIKIPKALPDDENEASTFIYMASGSSDSTTYQQYLDEFIQKFPSNNNAYTQRADFYLAHGNYSKAEEDINAALEHSPNKAEVYYTISKMLYGLNLRKDYNVYKDWNMEKAGQMIDEAINLNHLPVYTFQAGQICYALKEYEKAFNHFIELTHTNMRSADMFLYAAQCKTMLKADTASILALQDSAVACFTKPYIKEAAPALMARANTKLAMERYREAVIDLNEYEKLMRNELNANFYYLREQAEMKGRLYQQAIDDIDRAIRMEPKEPLYHAERAVVYYTIGEFAEAIKSAQKATELAPDYTDGYRILGICQIYNKEREKGIANLQKAADLGDNTAREVLKQEIFQNAEQK